MSSRIARGLVVALCAIVLAACGESPADPDGGITLADGAYPDGRIPPPDLESYLRENSIEVMEHMPDGTERGHAITGAEGYARFFSEDHAGVFALDLAAADLEMPIAGLEVTVSVADENAVYLVVDPNGVYAPLFFSTPIPESGEHEIEIDGYELATYGEVLDFDPSAGNPWETTFSFAGISVSMGIRGLLIGLALGAVGELLNTIVSETCKFFAPVHAEICDLAGAITGAAVGALGGYYVAGTSGLGSLAGLAGGVASELVCMPLGAGLVSVTYQRDPTTTGPRDRYRQLAYDYNYLLHRLETEPLADGGNAAAFDLLEREGAAIAALGNTVRASYFEIANPEAADNGATLGIAASATAGALRSDRVFREWVLSRLTISRGMQAMLGIGPDGVTLHVRQWRYLRGEYRQTTFREATRHAEVLGPLVDCAFGFLEAAVVELEEGLMREEEEITTELMIGTMIDLWRLRMQYLHQQWYGGTIPMGSCTADEYEPNGTWMQAYSRPVPVMLTGEEAQEIQAMNLCDYLGMGGGEEDWYAYYVGPIELMVQASIRRPSESTTYRGRGENMCLEIYYYSYNYEISSLEPEHITGPVCGTGDDVYTTPFSVARTLGEPWSMVMVRVFPGDGHSGAVTDYDLRFTP